MTHSFIWNLQVAVICETWQCRYLWSAGSAIRSLSLNISHLQISGFSDTVKKGIFIEACCVMWQLMMLSYLLTVLQSSKLELPLFCMTDALCSWLLFHYIIWQRCRTSLRSMNRPTRTTILLRTVQSVREMLSYSVETAKIWKQLCIYSVEVLVLDICFCCFILLLHCISYENVVLCTAVHSLHTYCYKLFFILRFYFIHRTAITVRC